MTIPFMSYLNRTGLDMDDAQEVDYLTSITQAARPWIDLQVSFRAQGLKKFAKAEAAAVIVTETFKIKENLEEEENLALLRAAVAVYGYQYQKNLTDNFEVYKISSDLISKYKKELDEQFKKSEELSKNKGFFEKLLN